MSASTTSRNVTLPGTIPEDLQRMLQELESTRQSVNRKIDYALQPFLSVVEAYQTLERKVVDLITKYHEVIADLQRQVADLQAEVSSLKNQASDQQQQVGGEQEGGPP